LGCRPKDVKGITDGSSQHVNIPEKSRGKSLPVLHEIFHTLYFNRDGNRGGISGGKALPTKDEINILIKGIQDQNRIVPIEPEKK
jgi:hypothetical protein